MNSSPPRHLSSFHAFRPSLFAQPLAAGGGVIIEDDLEMKKLTLLLLIAAALILTGYVVIRNYVGTPGFRPDPPPSSKVATKSEETPLDLRPQLIEKIQELVHKGSDGLYNISIREVEPDLIASTVFLKNIQLFPDTATLRKLRLSGQLPSDIFSISLDSLRITGIGAEDLINQDHLDLKTLLISHPVITVQQSGASKKSERSLQDRLSGMMKSFRMGELKISDGEIIVRKANGKSTRLPHINMLMSEILIDSSTKNDHSRFLFAKQARLSLKDFSFTSTDKVYDYHVGNLEVNAALNELTATSISITPKYPKSEWIKRTKTQKERFELKLPSARLEGMDWWALVQDQSLLASAVTLRSPVISIYLNRYAPAGSERAAGFPHQMIMHLPMKINLQNIRVSNASIAYEEVNPLSAQSGKLTINGLNGTITNVTNQQAAIAKNGWTRVRATGSVMNKIPATMGFDFDLRNYKSGAFLSTISLDDFDGDVVNPVTEPIGMFHIKRGQIHSLSSKVSGTVAGASGNVSMLYESLHITPLEKDNKRPGQLEKRNFTSFLANALLLKNENPSKGNPPRTATAYVKRNPKASFMNLVWKTTFTGILKIIGAPERLAK